MIPGAKKKEASVRDEPAPEKDAVLPVVVVGAGPAGLATSARLKRAEIEHVVLEKEPRAAASWHRNYERVCLHTVKETSHLPFVPFEDDDPRYIPRDRLIEYLEDYQRHFDIHPRLGVEVERIEKENGHWTVRTTTGEVLAARHVVMATGFNRVPNEPSWPWQPKYEGEILHSRHYLNGEPWRDRDVLVVGMGNTGAEIALDLLEHGARPTISVRGPVNIVPRDAFGRPTQKTALMLAKLPEGLGDFLGVVLRKLTVGNLSKWGVETPEQPPAAQLRTTGKTPVIDVGTVREIKKGRIAVRPGVECYTATGVRFADGTESDFAAVVLATGYRSLVERLVPAAQEILDPQGNPPAGPAPEPCRGLHFVGFDGYALGGIFRTIRIDSETVVDAIAASLS